MEENFNHVKQRILQYLKYKGISIRKFSEKISISPSNFNEKNMPSALSSDILCSILTEFEELNSEWLLTGKGEMLRSGTPKNAQNGHSDDLVLKILAEKDRRIEQLILEKRELEEQLNTVLRVSADLQAVTPPPIRWCTDRYGEKYLMF